MKIDKHTIKSHIPKTFKSLNVGAVFEAEVVDIMENEIKLKAFDGTIIRSKYNKIGFKIGEKTDFIITNKTKEGLVEIEEVRTDVKRVDKVLEKLLLERLPINETILKRIKYFMKNEASLILEQIFSKFKENHQFNESI